MSKNLALTLKLDANGNLVGVLDQASQKVKTFGKTVDDSSNLTQKFYQTLESVTRLAAVGISTIGVANFAQSMAEAGKKTESFLAQLKVATGSVDNAKTAFDALNKLNALMPESVEGITQAFIKMKNLGLEPTAQALMSFSNTASANGKDIMQFVEAVADAATGEFERLKEFGIKAKTEGEKVSLTFRGVTTSIKNDAESITGYLQSIGENEFAGMAEAQMQTLSGAISNAEASYEGFLNAMNSATGTSETYKGVLMSLSQTLDAVNAAMAIAYGESDKVTNAFSGLVSIGKGVATTIQAIAATFEMLSTAVGFVGAAIASFGDSSVSFSNLWDAYNREIAEITNKTLKFNEALYATPKPVTIDEVAKALNPLAANTTKASTATKALTESKKELEKAAKAAEKALREELEAIADAQNLLDKYLDTDFDKQLKAIKEIDTAWAKLYNNGLSNQQQFADALYAMDLEQFAEKVEVANKKMVEDSKESADAVRVAWEQSIKRLDDAFANVWEDIFSGASDFGSSLKRWFTSLLAELAHAAITKPIVISMSGAMGIGGASSALASSGGAGGAFDIIGNIGSMYSGVTSMIGAGATYLGSIAAGAGSAQAAMLASQSAAFGLEGAALTTGALTGGTAATSVLSTMASAAPYVAAILAIDALTGGSISTGVFGGARGERTRALNIGIANGQVSDASNIYRATHYDAGWGRSGSWNVDNLGGAEFNQIIKDTVNSMAVSIRDNAERLGLEFNEGFSGQFDADLFGKTAEETQQIIADTFVRIGQSMVDSVSGLSDAMTPLQRSGEQTYETLARVVGQFDAFNYPVGRLNDSLATLSISTLSAVDSLVSMAGSMTNLQAMQSGFITAFYTDAQKAELTTQSVTRLFDAIGLSAPASREALVGLVQGLDLTTEAGQRAYLAITGATATLDQFYSAIERQPMTNITNSQVSIDYKQLVNDAFSSLKESVQVELDAVSKTYNARVSALSLETDAIKKNISALSTMRTALQSTYDTITASTSNPLIRYTTGQSTLQSILSSYRLGIAPVQSDLDRALRDVSVNDQAYYASFEDYSRDQAITSGIIAQIMALTDDSLSIEDRTLAAIDAQLKELKRQYDLDVSALNQTLDIYQQQVNAINGVNTSVLSVQEAIASLASAISGAMSASRAATAGANIPSYAYDAYSVEDSPEVRQAKVEAQTGQVVSASDSAQLAAAKVLYQSVTGGANTAQYNAALDAIGGSFSNIGWDGSREGAAALVLKYGGSLPAFASGGDHLGGIRLVGENGPELEVTGPSRIFNAQQTHNILRGTNSDNSDALIAEIKALRAEVSALRNENTQLTSAMLNENRKQTRLAEKADADGVRVEIMA